MKRLSFVILVVFVMACCLHEAWGEESNITWNIDTTKCKEVPCTDEQIAFYKDSPGRTICLDCSDLSNVIKSNSGAVFAYKASDGTLFEDKKEYHEYQKSLIFDELWDEYSREWGPNGFLKNPTTGEEKTMEWNGREIKWCSCEKVIKLFIIKRWPEIRAVMEGE